MIAIVYMSPHAISEEYDIIRVFTGLTEKQYNDIEKKASKRNRKAGIYYGVIRLEDGCLNNNDW